MTTVGNIPVLFAPVVVEVTAQTVAVAAVLLDAAASAVLLQLLVLVLDVLVVVDGCFGI